MDAPPGVREALGEYGFVLEPARISSEVSRSGGELRLHVRAADTGGQLIAEASATGAIDAVQFENSIDSAMPLDCTEAAAPHAVAHEFAWMDQVNVSFPEPPWSWDINVPDSRLAVFGGKLALEKGSAAFAAVLNSHAQLYRSVGP
jgi:hypothetical protein